MLVFTGRKNGVMKVVYNEVVVGNVWESEWLQSFENQTRLWLANINGEKIFKGLSAEDVYDQITVYFSARV